MKKVQMREIKIIELILAFGVLLSGASGQKPELYVQTGNDSIIYSATFSPDGKVLASCGDGGAIRLFDVINKKEIRSFKTFSLDVCSISFSADSEILAAGGWDGVTLWDVRKGLQIKSIKIREGIVNSVVFSPRGRLLAIGSQDRTIRFWDIAVGREIKRIIKKSGEVQTVAFSPDGKLLASGDDNGNIELWCFPTGNLLKRFNESGSIKSIAFNPDGKTIVGAGSHGIFLWDFIDGRKLDQIKTDEFVYSVSFSPNGLYLASAGFSRSALYLVDEKLSLYEDLGYLDIKSSFSVAFSSNSEELLFGLSPGTGNENAYMKLIKLRTGETVTFKRQSSQVNSIALNSDGQTLASGNSDGTIKFWDLTKEGLKSFIVSDVRAVNCVVYSPDGKLLISGGARSISNFVSYPLEVWENESGKLLKTLNGHEADVISLSVSSDGKKLASVDLRRTLKLWDLSSGQLLRTFSISSSPIIKEIAFKNNDVYLVTVDVTDAIKIWDISTGNQLEKLNKFEGISKTKEFIDSGNGSLQFISDEFSIKFQNRNTKKEIAALFTFNANDWLITTPEGLFDGSPNAWKQLIWRFDNNTFNYAPVEAFFKEFYYPGLLQEIMQGKTPKPPAKDLSEIDIRQPTVKITEINGKPTDATEKLSADKQTVKVRVEIKDNSKAGRKTNFPAASGANDLRLFRNGSLVRLWKKRGVASDKTSSVFALGKQDGCTQIPAAKDTPRKAVCETEVTITSGENNFTAYAFNHEDVKSNDATAQIEGKFAKKDGTLYVLAIGVNKYANSSYDLRYAVPDVLDMQAAIKEQQAKLAQDAKLKQYAKTEVITLKDAAATKENILLALGRFSKDAAGKSLPGNLCANLSKDVCEELKADLAKIRPTEPEDALLIYFAGHGTARGQRFYLLPHNFTGKGGENELIKQAVSDIEMNQYLERVDAGRMLMVIDACQSGQALGAQSEGRGPMNSKGLAQLAYDKGMLILTAAQSQQAALEAVRIGGKEVKHGLLTYALLEAMKNLQADKDGNRRLSEREWFDYSVEHVPILQREAMSQRNAEIKQTGRGIEIIYVNGDKNKNPDERSVQTPRVFYRRETDNNPVIIAQP